MQLFLCALNAKVLLCVCYVYLRVDGPCRGPFVTNYMQFRGHIYVETGQLTSRGSVTHVRVKSTLASFENSSNISITEENSIQHDEV